MMMMLMMLMMAIKTIKMMVLMISIAKVGEHNSWYISCRGAQVTLFVFINILYIILHIFVLIHYISIFILSPRGAGDQIFFPEPEIQSKLKGRDGKRISTLIHMHFCRRGNGMENL